MAATLGLAACGDDEEEAGGTPDSAAEARVNGKNPAVGPPLKPSELSDLEEFLMKKGEEPGFKPVGEPDYDASLEEFVSSGGLSAEDYERLGDDGFLATLYQPLDGPPKTAGVTVMTLYEDEAGAKSDMAHELSSSTLEDLGLKLEDRFTAPGIPGARGWTGKDVHGFNIGHVYWVQGRCMLLIGNEGPGPFPKPLSKGANAIYERTDGKCP